MVPTISFRLLYGLLILQHDRRQILWLGVTAHPTAEWISHQLTEAYGWKVAPQHIIRDRDAVYGDVFIRRLRAMSIRDRPTAPRSPWQNGYCERAIGSIRRECLDHVVVFGERHLHHLLRSYATYYNSARTHPFNQQGRAVAANSTCRWAHFAYAISWRTSSSKWGYPSATKAQGSALWALRSAGADRSGSVTGSGSPRMQGGGGGNGLGTVF